MCDNKKSRVASSKIANLVSSADSSLVGPLSEYRAELIHYETAPAKGFVQTTLERSDNNSFNFTPQVSINVPRRFLKYVAVPYGKAQTPDVPITVASGWLMSKAHQFATDIRRELERELKREYGMDPDDPRRIVVIH